MIRIIRGNEKAERPTKSGEVRIKRETVQAPDTEIKTPAKRGRKKKEA